MVAKRVKRASANARADRLADTDRKTETESDTDGHGGVGEAHVPVEWDCGEEPRGAGPHAGSQARLVSSVGRVLQHLVVQLAIAIMRHYACTN